MSQFHRLTVADIHKTIRQAAVLTLVPDDPEAFAFLPGQYLTFRHTLDGHELRRSYSICAGLDDAALQVGIKEVAGGAFSTWANQHLKVGDTLEAMSPMGRFQVTPDADHSRHYLAFAGGSGITPILSILRSVLAREPDARVTLVYANRAVSTIMFREEIEDLKNRHMGRLNVIHVLETSGQDIDLFAGRVDSAKCDALFEHWIQIDTVDTALICGPEPMMKAISQSLERHGLAKDQIKYELFASGQPGRLPQSVPQGGTDQPQGAQATAILGGERHQFTVLPGQSLLQSALGEDMDAPFACTAGVCSTCRAKVLEGEVEMANNHALEDGEVARGYVLTCQSYVLSDHVVFDYDQ